MRKAVHKSYRVCRYIETKFTAMHTFPHIISGVHDASCGYILWHFQILRNFLVFRAQFNYQKIVSLTTMHAFRTKQVLHHLKSKCIRRSINNTFAVSRTRWGIRNIYSLNPLYVRCRRCLKVCHTDVLQFYYWRLRYIKYRDQSGYTWKHSWLQVMNMLCFDHQIAVSFAFLCGN